MQLKLSQKLISMMLLILIIPTIVIGAISFFIAKDHMDELGKTTLKNGVETAVQLIDVMNERVESGDITLEEAQEEVKVYLIGEMKSDGKRDINNSLDLGENGYFVVYDKSGLEVAHPSIEGKNVWDVKDVEGKTLVQEQINAAQNGGGFTTYKWTLPNDEKVVANKITYNKLDPNWGWIISAGTYEMDFNKGANSLLKIILITLVIAILVGGFISFIFSRHISKPIKDITNKVNEVANGNLMTDVSVIKRKDEIGELVNGFHTMVGNLRSLIGKVDHSISNITNTSQNLSAVAEETTASSEEIGKAIEEISRGAIQQASDAEDTNQTTLILSEQTQLLFDKTQLMKEASTKVQESNEIGLSSVKSLKQKSNETDQSVQQARNVMESLSKSVKEIELIIGTINDISEQTNLLALNASIEAARAGEHGKGFAVVATEVRKLAEQTSGATEKVRQTLSGIVKETTNANNEMDKTKELAHDQLIAVSETEESFKVIANSINGIGKIIEEVDVNIHSLIHSNDRVNKSIESIAAVSQESAASTEQINSSIDEQVRAIGVVSESATELNDLISDLKFEINKFSV